MSVQAAPKKEVDALVDRVLAMDSPQACADLVKQNPAAEWGEVIRILTERVWQEVRVDARRAEQIANTAVELAQAYGNPLSLGKSLRAKANTLYALDQHITALEFHDQSILQFERAGNDAELARTLSGSIQPLLLLGRYDQALAVGERARKIFQQQGNSHRLARLEINLGNIYHRQDRFAEALEIYERAYQELLKHDDAEGVAAALSNLSLCCIGLNDFPKALEL